MIQNQIRKVLSIFFTHKVKALLIGGQACITYGASEFTRDIDLAIMVSSENLEHLKLALKELEAERIYYPELSEDVLFRGHACHFKCQQADTNGLRIDVMGVMRGVDSFSDIWKRREEINLPGTGKVAVMGLSDLIKSKKTQRDKDWSMIRRLIEADFYNASDNPLEDKIRLWLAECRTPEILISLASKYPDITSQMIPNRPLLKSVVQGNQKEIMNHLRVEEDRERELDRVHWEPLRAELETWRRDRNK